LRNREPLRFLRGAEGHEQALQDDRQYQKVNEDTRPAHERETDKADRNDVAKCLVEQ